MFRPLLQPYERLCAFNTDYARGIYMVPVANSEVKGVKTMTYFIDNQTFAVNETLYQTIQGFANMTKHRQAPVYQSHPHMFSVAEAYRNKIEGQRAPVWDKDLTRIEVEPLTGKVVVEHKMLQMNLFTAPDFQFNWFNFMMPTDTFYPTMWALQGAMLTDANAQEIKTKVYLPLKLKQVGIDYMLPIGVTVAVIALAELISVCVIVRRRARGNDDVSLYTTSQVVSS
jgi:CD36 family